MRIAIVGGGVGGLTAARALAANGHDVHIFEANDRAGGVVATSVVDGFLCEHAASSFRGGAVKGAAALCKELGVAVESAAPQAKRRYVYLDGKLRMVPSNPIELVRCDLLTWRGKLALVREPFSPRREPRNEDQSMHDFAARRLGPEAARAFIAPLVTGVYAADSHEVSLEAGFPTMAALDREGGFVRGTLKRLVRSRRAAAAPGRGGIAAPVGGLGSLINALATDLGSRLHRGVRVRAIEPVSNGVLVDGERWDAAVVAIPAQTAAPLLRAMPQLVLRLQAFRRSGVAIVYLGVPQDCSPRIRDAFGFLTAQGEDLRALGVVFESTLWRNRAPAGQALLRCIFAGSRDPSAYELTDRELIEQATRDVSRAFGTAIECTHTSVRRSPLGLPHYPVGHRDHVRDAVALARLGRIVLAGADYRGAGINDLAADADVIASEIALWG